MPKERRGVSKKDPRISVKVSLPIHDHIVKNAQWGESIDHTLRRLLGVAEEKGTDTK